MPDTSPPPGRRHPEKAGRPDQPSPKKPDWIRVRIPAARAEDAGGSPGQGAPGQGASGVGAPGRPATGYGATKAILRGHKLHTVCEEAACPNIGECWARRHATYMILGAICTRACAFCNVATGKPGAVDATEPARLARSVADLGLKHVVITSVDRDDLPDGGAEQFVRCIAGIRATSPGTTIEVLTPDFRGKRGAGERVFAAAPDVFNHNLETVPRLYPTIRPGARYYVSLRLLDDAKAANPGLFTKSGIMVGLGEERAEILAVMDDLRSAHVDFLTIGQYLQPTPKHAAVARFVPPEEFAELKEIALARGFLMVAASPLTRSSYHADRDFALLQESRRAALAGAG